MVFLVLFENETINVGVNSHEWIQHSRTYKRNPIFNKALIIILFDAIRNVGEFNGLKLE